ncbi:MAG TPA: ATP-binding protein [Verrucomicrobiae bacterium]|nr:ATP-binding protein [Verrucomicrobiae bacterium]
MLIKRQFYFAFAAVILALIAATAILVFMHMRLQRMEEIRAWSNEVVKAAFDCNVLGTESILQDSDRAQEQYRIAARNLMTLLDRTPNFKGVGPMAADLRASKKRLDALLHNFEDKPRASPDMLREGYELQTMVVSQWMVQTRALLDAAQQMRSYAARETARIRRVSLWADVAALSVIALVSGWVFWRSYRTLVNPLQQLSEGARRVGEGDLNHRLDTPYDNEIGQAAANFNRMTEQLGERDAQLNEKLRDLEAFCYSVAHDLKAPLRSVAGFGDLLRAEYKDALGEEGLGYVERMRAGSLRMAALIDDLLKFGQLTHQRVEITMLPLKPVCEELVNEIKDEVARANGSVQLEIGDEAVQANAFLLKQAVTNLIGNALKFVKKETPPVIKITARKERGWVELSVEDNGIGIPEEFHNKIFGLFHRLHEYRDYPGTGVGLAIVQKSVERMGGRVTLQSAAGKGTTFSIRLRAALV